MVAVRYTGWNQDGTRGDETGRVANLGVRQIRFGKHMLVVADDADWEGVSHRARQSGIDLPRPRGVPDSENICVVRQKGRLFERAFPDARIIHNGGRFLAVLMNEEEYARASRHESFCFEVGPLPKDDVVFERREHRSSRRAVPEWVLGLVDSVSQDEYRTLLEQIVAFPTRYATSAHYGSAADLCRARLTNLGYETRIQEVSFGSSVTSNVIAEKPGTAAERKLVIAMAHLDSINIEGDAGSIAPGADDNGSGSAAVLELARVLRNHVAEHDLQLVLFGGEELGLHGSKHYVSTLGSDRERVVAALNMDMIAGRNVDDRTVLIEAGERTVVDELADAADSFTSLKVETSLNPFASDHVPFIQAGLPAALTIEGADSRNANIHTANDTLAHVDTELAYAVIRMNAGFLAKQLGEAGG